MKLKYVITIAGVIISGILMYLLGIYGAVIIGVFFVSIMIHEFGHLVVAKLFGMQVDQYSIGMGRKSWQIFGFEYKKIHWSIRPLPIGGFVDIPGMNLASDETPEKGTYAAAPWYAQVAVAFAGPATNFMLAIVILFAGLALLPLDGFAGTAGISQVESGSPAQTAGLESGDVIVSVNGEVTESWDEVIASFNVDSSNNVVVERNNEPVVAKMTVADWEGSYGPAINPGANQPLTVVAQETYSELQMFASTTIWLIGALPEKFIQMTHAVATNVDAPVERPASVIGIVSAASDNGPAQGWLFMIRLAAMLNIALGIFNLLPLMPLDGGHIVASITNRLMVRNRFRVPAVKLIGSLAYPVIFAFIALTVVVMIIDVQQLF